MELHDRVELYRKAFPKFPAPVINNGRIEGIWIMGNNYQTSGYYGAYPHGYLPRVKAMFPERFALHLFSGSLPPGDYVRFDRLPDKVPEYLGDVCGDAEELSKYFQPGSFDVIFADPPYSQEDAEHYGCALINRKKVLEECYKVLVPGGWVIWLDQVLPMWRKDMFDLKMLIGMVKSSNHRFRVVCGFQKIDEVMR